MRYMDLLASRGTLHHAQKSLFESCAKHKEIKADDLVKASKASVALPICHHGATCRLTFFSFIASGDVECINHGYCQQTASFVQRGFYKETIISYRNRVSFGIFFFWTLVHLVVLDISVTKTVLYMCHHVITRDTQGSSQRTKTYYKGLCGVGGRQVVDQSIHLVWPCLVIYASSPWTRTYHHAKTNQPSDACT